MLNGERTYVPRYRCSTVPMFPEPMFPGTYVPRTCVPRDRCSPFFTLIVVISINLFLEYDGRLGLYLGFRFRVLVKVTVNLRLNSL